MEKQKLVKIFDKQANQYERRRKNASDQRWRQPLLKDAAGEVLELAVGAGANFPFYPPGVKITAADFSEAMLEKAKQAAAFLQLPADFICSDIEELHFPNDSFDTIVSTLSLCSYDDPLLVLQKINRWCKPDGKILLMEHGISTNLLVSALQKTLDPLLYRYSGCHHTRDMIKLVQDAGLKIEKTEGYWINMVHLIWARPQKSP